MPLHENINIQELITLSHGYSGAEVVSSCTEAAILAIEENSSLLEQRHLISVMRNLKPQITPAMLEYYERIAQQFYS